MSIYDHLGNGYPEGMESGGRTSLIEMLSKVVRDFLAPGNGGQGLENLRLDAGLDGANRAVGHESLSGKTALASENPAERPPFADIGLLVWINAAYGGEAPRCPGAIPVGSMDHHHRVAGSVLYVPKPDAALVTKDSRLVIGQGQKGG